MAWNITLLSTQQDAANPANLTAVLRFSDGIRTIDRTFGPANTLTTDYLREAAKAFIANIEAADAIKAAYPAPGAKVTVKDPDADPQALLDFRRDWRRLQKLLSLQSTTPATVTRVNQLRTAVETAIAANPTWIDDPRI